MMEGPNYGLHGAFFRRPWDIMRRIRSGSMSLLLLARASSKPQRRDCFPVTPQHGYNSVGLTKVVESMHQSSKLAHGFPCCMNDA